MRRRSFGFFLACSCVFASSIARPAHAESARAFLQREMGFSKDEFQTLDRGKVVIRSLKPEEKGEIGVVGIVRVAGTKEHFLERFRQFEQFRRGRNIVTLARFRNPPLLSDLTGLTIEPADIKALRTCKKGDCSVKLSAHAMERLHTEVSWSADDAREQAERVVRNLLLDQVSAYIRAGDGGLGTYDDRDRSVGVADGFHKVCRRLPFLAEPSSTLRRYMEDFPRTEMPGIEHFMYWSKEDYGLKPITSINHVVIEASPEAPERVLIATRQIYANHYLEASLDLMALMDDPAANPGTVLIYWNRSIADGLKGTFGGLIRAIAQRKVRDAAQGALLTMKERVEAAR
jgi:hypothetical protein